MNWLDNFYKTEIKKIKQAKRYRQIYKIRKERKYLITEDNRRLLNLASNDYLGLANNPIYIEDFYSKNKIKSPGSTASRLLSGDSPELRKTEEAFATWLGKESAILLPSGYHANTGLLSVFSDTDTCIFMDKSCHASIYDGIKLSGLKFYRYQHNNIEKLESLLKKHREKHKYAIIATESLFSMDGDTADIKSIAQLAEKYDCLSMVDEAHSIGVRGPHGAGITREYGLENSIDIIIATGGKAMGGNGGIIACSKQIKTLIINKSRPLIYSTAMSPLAASWLYYAIKKIRTMEEERKKLKELWQYARKRLSGIGISYGKSCMQIIPAITGSSEKAILLAERLRQKGFFAPAIRPPTVRESMACIRLSLTTLIEKDDIDMLIEAMELQK